MQTQSDTIRQLVSFALGHTAGYCMHKVARRAALKQANAAAPVTCWASAVVYSITSYCANGALAVLYGLFDAAVAAAAGYLLSAQGLASCVVRIALDVVYE